MKNLSTTTKYPDGLILEITNEKATEGENEEDTDLSDVQR